ncbi:hypothetical protein [Actinoplanes sp. G11-F43]|uniref:hypothetical protein n=1 Tax=Actinoplanes sp. G11-F43 TaxID=3424130 RepID=UPI003D34E6AE
MNVFTERLVGSSALLITTTLLAACGVGEAVKDVAGEVSAATTLTKALPNAGTPVFHYRIKGGVQPLAGVVDAPNKSMTTEINEKIPDAGLTLSMKFLVIGDQAWTRISFDGAKSGSGLPKLPKKWMKLDSGKLSADSAEDLTYQGETDPGFVSSLLLASADLKETGERTYAGTTDLTRSTEAEIVESEVLTALGEKAKAVPLELTLDAEGRITTALVEIPAAGKAGAATYEVVYDQYGSATPVTAPADGVAATEDVYELLNG